MTPSEFSFNPTGTLLGMHSRFSSVRDHRQDREGQSDERREKQREGSAIHLDLRCPEETETELLVPGMGKQTLTLLERTMLAEPRTAQRTHKSKLHQMGRKLLRNEPLD